MKNLSATLQVEINPLVNKLEYMNNRKPSKPSLPNLLEPSKLLLSTNFLESWSLVFTSFLNPVIPRYCIHKVSLTSFGKFQMFLKFQNTLYFEQVGVVFEYKSPINKLEYMNNKRPSKLNLPNVLEPSKLLLPTNFSESCLHQFSRSRNTTLLHQPSLTGFFWQISNAS